MMGAQFPKNATEHVMLTDIAVNLKRHSGFFSEEEMTRNNRLVMTVKRNVNLLPNLIAAVINYHDEPIIQPFAM